MTEDEARSWIADRFGANGVTQMTKLAELVRTESPHQNLVSATSLDHLWSRHIVDSAQLIGLADAAPGRWLDVGTGAGFPGIVVAALTGREVVLVEPRKRRVEFLAHCSRALGFDDRVTIIPSNVERAEVAPVAVISARAVASLEALFANAAHCSTWNTLWILPKGKAAREEIANARATWHGLFHVERSVTDAASLVVVAQEVSRR